MEQKGSFIGFTFGNRHSSELGIFRTSSSDRYGASMIATTDVVTELGTVDGQYYWGSTYSKRDIPISFAFYGLSEEQLIQLKQIFNDKKIHSLILDEEPYKVWSVKLTGIMVAKHLCFQQGASRFYCGEGTLNFTAYYPFARSRYQYYEDYHKENIREWIDDEDFSKEDVIDIIQPAILQYDFSEEELEEGCGYIIAFDEWLSGVNLMTESELDMKDINSSIDVFYNYNPYGNRDHWIKTSGIPKKEDGYGNNSSPYKLYNAGDIKMPFKIYFPVSNTAQNISVECADCKISLQNVVAKGNDKFIVLDGFALTVQGCDINKKKTKNLYNDKIVEGGLFQLPIGEIELITSTDGELEFNYLYL